MAETDFIDDDGVNENAKKFMFVNRRAPYGTLYALESLELVLITGAFEQDVSVAFIDDGVFDIVKGQDTKAINMKNFSPTYRALEGYDIEKMYVEKESIEERGLTADDFVVPVEILSAEDLSALMADQDVVVSA
ncbi:MAG: sulfurtransferase complex subunit TusC [Alphaproteobacteria bacterium]|nr:sulfurtransferase complex subunit TusC [Alphaproteobacteria bacterium]